MEFLQTLQVFGESLLCPLCSGLLNSAVTFSTCGHTFCRDCVLSRLEGPGINTSECPCCHQPGWKNDLHTNHQLNNAVERLKELKDILSNELNKVTIDAKNKGKRKRENARNKTTRHCHEGIKNAEHECCQYELPRENIPSVSHCQNGSENEMKILNTTEVNNGSLEIEKYSSRKHLKQACSSDYLVTDSIQYLGRQRSGGDQTVHGSASRLAIFSTVEEGVHPEPDLGTDAVFRSKLQDGDDFTSKPDKATTSMGMTTLPSCARQIRGVPEDEYDKSWEKAYMSLPPPRSESDLKALQEEIAILEATIELCQKLPMIEKEKSCEIDLQSSDRNVEKANTRSNQQVRSGDLAYAIMKQDIPIDSKRKFSRQRHHSRCRKLSSIANSSNEFDSNDKRNSEKIHRDMHPKPINSDFVSLDGGKELDCHQKSCRNINTKKDSADTENDGKHVLVINEYLNENGPECRNSILPVMIPDSQDSGQENEERKIQQQIIFSDSKVNAMPSSETQAAVDTLEHMKFCVSASERAEPSDIENISHVPFESGDVNLDERDLGHPTKNGLDNLIGTKYNRSKERRATGGRKSKSQRGILDIIRASQMTSDAPSRRAVSLAVGSDSSSVRAAGLLKETFGDIVSWTKDVEENTTHVLVQTDDRLVALRRNARYLRGLALGCWVVSMVWVDACVQSGNLVNEQGYEVKGVKIRKSMDIEDAAVGGAERARLRRTYNTAGLFRGMKFHLRIVGERIESMSLVRDLLFQQGGKLLDRIPEKGSEERENLVIVASSHVGDGLAMRFSNKVHVVEWRWVLDSITTVKKLPLEQYAFSHKRNRQKVH